jgi:hypothetical protein
MDNTNRVQSFAITQSNLPIKKIFAKYCQRLFFFTAATPSYFGHSQDG